MSVPSFSSFPKLEVDRPKHKESESTESRGRDKRDRHDKSESSSKRKADERHRERETSRDRDRKHRKKDKDRRREKRNHGDGDDQQSEGKAEDIRDESYRLFFSDRKADLLNIQYNGLHAGDIPRYQLFNGGRFAVGLPPGLVLHRNGKGIEVCVRSRNPRLSSITDSRARSLLALPPNRRLVQPDSTRYPEVEGFIRLPSRKGKTKPEDTYRSITESRGGDSSASESESSEGDTDDEEEMQDTLRETSQQAQLRDLENRLLVNKGSVQTWLELLEVTLSSIPISSKNAKRARSDITLSILERALQADPATKTSPLLRVKYLKAGEDIWDEAQLLAQWEVALDLDDAALWIEWLEWRIRRNKQGVDGLFEDANRVLSSAPFQQDTIESELARLRIFWRTLLAVQAAGFTERAMAMLQAQLELTFNIPPQVDVLSFSHQLDELEQFWDSEVPRALEEGAKGWRHWYQSGRQTSAGAVPSPSATISVRDLDPYRQWALQEAEEDQAAKFPSRSTSDSDDPYSTVFFSDIRDSLIKISSPTAKRTLRLVLLSFLGLPLPGLSELFSLEEATNWDDRWSMKAFIGPSLLRSIVPEDSNRPEALAESIAGTIIAHEKEYRDPFGPIKQWPLESVSPLEVRMRGGKMRLLLWDTADVGHVDQKLLLRVFSQLRQSEEDFEWDSLALAFEAAINIKNALKLSKAFLSTPKESLEYWSAHAQLERIAGRFDGARKVYQTILVTSRPKPSQHGLSCLCWNWAEMEWLAGSVDQTVNCILRSLGIQSTTGVSILRAKQTLDESISNASRWQDRLNWLRLRVLLDVLTGTDIKDALGRFDQQIAVQEGRIARESFMMASLMFVFNHRVVLKNAMPPIVLRERAERALEAYPSNSIVWGVFLEGEKGQGVWGKVRSMLGSGNGKIKDVARRMQEVWIAGWEKGRWASEVERTRSGLAAAVEHERTRGSQVLWRLYMEVEIRAGKYQNAKKLLFRAIGECPLEKELYLLAFGPLRSVFGARELQSLCDLMVERGLRLRRGLEEVAGSVPEEVVKEEIMAVDEIEQNAQELRRLMPY